jgi:hypothetical protein
MAREEFCLQAASYNRLSASHSYLAVYICLTDAFLGTVLQTLNKHCMCCAHVLLYVWFYLFTLFVDHLFHIWNVASVRVGSRSLLYCFC